VPLVGAGDAVLALGVGVGDDEVGEDDGELGDEGAVEWVGLGDVDGEGEVIPGRFDEAQLLGLMDAGPVAPVPELLPPAWRLECV
jgi:hypothetical protein